MAKAELSLGISLLGHLAQLLDILSLGETRLMPPKHDQGEEEECELPSAGVSDGHDSHQTPPKFLNYAGRVEFRMVPVYPCSRGRC